MTITKLVPGINADVVKRGLGVFHLPAGSENGLSGILTAFDDRTVTIKGISGERGAEEDRIISADAINAGDYDELRYSDRLTSIVSEDADGWTVDGAVEIIDPDICRPGSFMMFRRNGDEEYTNGLIISVSEKSVRLSLLTGDATLGTGEITAEGFEAMVSPEIAAGEAGSTYERL